MYGRPELARSASLVLLLSAFGDIPFWVWFSRHIGKRLAYIMGMIILGIALMVSYLVGHRDVTILFIVLVFAGIGLATNYVIPWSIIPDVVDCDELTNGQRREGLFYGMWNFMQKLGLGIAAAISGLILDHVGYALDSIQTPQALHGIRLLIGPIPVVLFVIGILILYRYPINRTLTETFKTS